MELLTIKLEKEKIYLSPGKREIASLLVKEQISEREVLLNIPVGHGKLRQVFESHGILKAQKSNRDLKEKQCSFDS